MHRTHASNLFLRVRSKPIIEHSTGVRVAPWAAHVAPEPRLDALLQVGREGRSGAGRLRGACGAAQGAGERTGGRAGLQHGVAGCGGAGGAEL